MSVVEREEVRKSIDKYRKSRATLGDLIKIATSILRDESCFLGVNLLLKAIKKVRNIAAHESLTRKFCLLISEMTKEIGLKSG